MKLNKVSRVSAVALSALALVAGIGGTIAFQAKAQTTDPAATTTPTTQQAVQPGGQMDPAKGGHIGANGIKEELLTGDIAEKVKSAALVAVPGGTIQRVEIDAEGAVYEAHMTKADGTPVTVKFDANFGVTATESGHGRK